MSSPARSSFRAALGIRFAAPQPGFSGQAARPLHRRRVPVLRRDDGGRDLLRARGGRGARRRGGGDPGTETGEEPATTEAAPGTPAGDPAAGETVFASAGCGGCHTLEAAGSSGKVGPNLDDAKPDGALVIERSRTAWG